MESRRRKMKYRQQLFFYFMAIAIVPLLILGFYSYKSATSAVRQNIRQANETALVQVENKAVQVIDTVRQNFLRVATGNLTETMIELEYQEIPYPKLREFMEEICGDEIYVNYVSGYTFINYKNQWILSNKGMLPMEQVKNEEWLKSLEMENRKMFWINHSSMDEKQEMIEREYINDQYLNFIIKTPVYKQETQAAFIINISRTAFENLMKGNIANGSLVVFDQDGTLVYSENELVSSYYMDHPEELADGEQSSVRIKNADFDVVKRKTPVSGWTFIAAYDPSVADEQLRQILITMAGIIVVVLTLIGIISGFGTIKVYQPVRRLVDQIHEIMPEKGQDKEDEFGLIHEGLHTLAGQNEKLQDLIDRQKDQLIELFALRLIRGRLNGSEMTQTMARLDVELERYCCVLSVIFCQKAGAEREQMEQDVLNLELLKRLPGEIREILLFPPFIDTRAIVMILGGGSSERVEQKLLALRNCLSVFAIETYGGYLDMGVSQIFTEETGFHRAYHESLEALKVNEFSNRDEDTEGISMEDSSITYYADLSGHHQGIRTEEGVHLVMDGIVKEAIDACDEEKAFAVVEEFLRELNKSKVVLYEQQYYLYRFLMAILSVPADAGIPIHDIFPEGRDNLFLRFHQLYDFQTIRYFLEKEIIVPVINRMNLFRKSSSEVVLEKVLALIEQCHGDLTLAECAEQLGYHPSYIWRVMKNTKDITFTDYIARQKLEAARKMLVETDLPVAEIAQRLSYSNAQNFIRVFKKHMGITPGQYRKQEK